MARRATSERELRRIPDLTIENLQHSTYQCNRICAMCAWVGGMGLRLAPAWHGFHSRLLSEFDRRNSFPPALTFYPSAGACQGRANYHAPILKHRGAARPPP